MMDEEMEKKPRGIRDGIWTEDSGVPVPQDPEGVRKPVKKAGGGSVSSASKRADGIAVRGKTRGTIVDMCGGGMYKK